MSASNTSSTPTSSTTKRPRQSLLPNWATEPWSPKSKAILNMALASSIHFSGYEYARAATLTLVTSERTGFSSSSIVPFAMGCVSPFSLLLLWIYSKMLDASGPSTALRNCTLIYSILLAGCGLFLQSIDSFLIDSNSPPEQQEQELNNDSVAFFYHEISKQLLFFLFIAENCFVQLLFSQHWAFMSSVQTKEEAAVWFAPIAGIGSIASSGAAVTVAPLMDIVGLAGLLIAAAACMLLSAAFALQAYHIAKEHQFEPKPKQKTDANNENDNETKKKQNVLQRAIALFRRVPILGALCIEVIFSQCQTSLLNSLFVLKMKDTFPNDDERARYTGNVSFCPLACN